MKEEKQDKGESFLSPHHLITSSPHHLITSSPHPRVLPTCSPCNAKSDHNTLILSLRQHIKKSEGQLKWERLT
ncbi:MAG: hypothetical protein WA919_06745 [Coleofasciculaceae cyanobacterium]